MHNKYSFSQKISLFIWLIRTKILWKSARLIRFPFDIRGKRYINLGENLTTGIGCRIEAFEEMNLSTVNSTKKSEYKITFGKNVQLNDYVHISAINRITIGDNVLMASHIYISDNSHGYYKESGTSPLIPPIKRPYYTAPVSIGENTWIGEGAFIMPGVSIGNGCIIGAHSIVNKNIPPFCIAVGSPARIIKRYNSDTKCWEKIDDR